MWHTVRCLIAHHPARSHHHRRARRRRIYRRLCARTCAECVCAFASVNSSDYTLHCACFTVLIGKRERARACGILLLRLLLPRHRTQSRTKHIMLPELLFSGTCVCAMRARLWVVYARCAMCDACVCFGNSIVQHGARALFRLHLRVRTTHENVPICAMRSPSERALARDLALGYIWKMQLCYFGANVARARAACASEIVRVCWVGSRQRE